MRLTFTQKKILFNDLYDAYTRPELIHPDPLEFLHRYPNPQDREIAGIIASSLAYGRVAQILRSTQSILGAMSGSPYEFLMGATETSLKREYSGFRHRFTTAEEIVDFLSAIRKVIKGHGSLRECFLKYFDPSDDDITRSLEMFVKEIKARSMKKGNSLLPSPEKMSACKRLHLFLRWMVRKDAVDPGGWDEISPSKLIVPLDVHMHRICLAFDMTSRRQADLRTALEATKSFRAISPEDPVKYDFCLTRIGIRDDGISLKDLNRIAGMDDGRSVQIRDLSCL